MQKINKKKFCQYAIHPECKKGQINGILQKRFSKLNAFTEVRMVKPFSPLTTSKLLSTDQK